MNAKKVIGILSLLILLTTLSADEGPKIMVINSNASVEKYRIAQEAFTRSILLPVQEIDLGEKKWKLREIEDRLYDVYPDLAYCIGTKAYLLAKKFISERHIVFSSIMNWRRLRLARHTYGVSNELNPEMQLTLYRTMFPEVRKIGVLYGHKYNKHWFNMAREAAQEMGVKLMGSSLSKKRETLPELEALLPKIDVLWLISDPVVIANKDTLIKIFRQCDANKKPIFSYHDTFAEYGAVLIVSVDNPTTGRQAAAMSQEVLSGDLVKRKVQLPAGSHIILNLEKARDYGLTYGEMALSMVNRFVE